MDTFQLINLLKKDKYSKKYFCGVLPLDKIPLRKINKTCAFIINTQKSHLPGEHWLAIFLPKRGKIEYFDSFGRKPHHKEIKEFINVNRRRLKTNWKFLQNDNTLTCGKYCIFYIFMRSRKYSLERIINFFGENKEDNELIINDLFEKLKK